MKRKVRQNVLISLGIAVPLTLGAIAVIDGTNVVDFGFIGTEDQQQEASTTTAVTQTTVRIASTTSTTAPPPPAFKMANYDGYQVRWNPCDVPVKILLNSGGKLSVSQEASLARFLNQVALQISEMTGIVVLYSGTTDERTSTKVKSNEEILIQIDEPGKGLLKKDEGKYAGTSYLSWDRIRGSFREIDSFDIHLNSLDFVGFYFTISELNESGKRLIMHFLGQAMGLDQLDDDEMIGFGFDKPSQRTNEIMYWGSQVWPFDEPKWGPGDQIGMTLVGASNGCF